MSDAYSDNRLIGAFTPTTWLGGVRYFRERRVEHLAPRAGGAGWSAAVRGSRAQAYAVWVRAEADADDVSLDGECSCPAERPCKHMAATLLAVAREGVGGPKALAGDRSRVREDLAALRRWAPLVAEPLRPRRARKPSNQRVYFVVSVPRVVRPGTPRSVAVMTCRATVRKNGAAGTPTECDILGSFLRLGRFPAYATVEDQVLWLRTVGVGGVDYESPRLERSAEATAVFHDLVRTDRCHFEDTESPPLELGPSRRGRVEWVAGPDGTQRVAIRLDGEPAPAIEVLPLSPPHYLDVASGQVGPLELDVPEAVVDMPELGAESVKRLPDEALATLEGAGIPAPPALAVRWLVGATPTPRLRLLRGSYGHGFVDAHARLHADYGPASVPIDGRHGPRTATVLHDGELLRFTRDRSSERQWLDHVCALGFSRPAPGTGNMTLGDERRWLHFIEVEVPRLRERGFVVDIDPDLPRSFVESDEWFVDASPDLMGGEWFAFQLGVLVDGKRIDLIPAVVDAIRTGRIQRHRIRLDDDVVDLPLPDGRWARLPAHRLARVLDTVIELFGERVEGDATQISARDAAWLATLDGFTWLGDDRLGDLARQLVRADPLPAVAVPRTLSATLRGYQRCGLEWLQLLRDSAFGAVLADDMGLGKTIQTLAHLLVEKRERRLDRPCLVVAPRTVIHNWARECKRFAPTLSCGVYHGPGRRRVLSGTPPDLVVTTYALLRSDLALRETDWHVVVLDEAQAIKNPRTRAAQAAYGLRARQRICLTGTPMENNLEELWSIFTFAVPGLLGGASSFRARFRKPIEQRGDPERLAVLKSRIAPFMLRRTKAQVLDELPPKTEVLVGVPLHARQLDVYESVRVTMERKVREALQERGLARSQIIVLDALLKLRQICCHPELVDNEEVRTAAAPSAKTERLLELLQELHAESRHVLVFSQFTSMLDIIAKALETGGIAFEQITGKTTNREAVVERFQRGEVPVLLASLKAGGTGINLTAADTVIHYDPWWNPAVEAQATDRAHRIGQERPITVYRLVCEGTVEERMLALQAEKRSLVEAVQNGAEARGATGFRLGPEEVARLLAPADRG